MPIFPLGSNHNQKLIQQVYQWTGVQISYQEDFTCAICWKCTLTLEEFQRFCDRCRKSDWVIKQKRSEGGGGAGAGAGVGRNPVQKAEHPTPQNHVNNAPNQMDDRRFGYPLYPLMQPTLGYEFRLTNDPRDRSHPTDPTRAMVRNHNETIQGGSSSHVTPKSESRIDIDTEFKHVLPVERLPEELVNMLDLPASSSKRLNPAAAVNGNSSASAANNDGTPPKIRSTQYQKIVESGGVKCPICKKPYTTDKNLKKHLRHSRRR